MLKLDWHWQTDKMENEAWYKYEVVWWMLKKSINMSWHVDVYTSCGRLNAKVVILSGKAVPRKYFSNNQKSVLCDLCLLVWSLGVELLRLCSASTRSRSRGWGLGIKILNIGIDSFGKLLVSIRIQFILNGPVQRWH